MKFYFGATKDMFNANIIKYDDFTKKYLIHFTSILGEPVGSPGKVLDKLIKDGIYRHFIICEAELDDGCLFNILQTAYSHYNMGDIEVKILKTTEVTCQ